MIDDAVQQALAAGEATATAAELLQNETRTILQELEELDSDEAGSKARSLANATVDALLLDRRIAGRFAGELYVLCERLLAVLPGADAPAGTIQFKVIVNELVDTGQIADLAFAAELRKSMNTVRAEWQSYDSVEAIAKADEIINKHISEGQSKGFLTFQAADQLLSTLYSLSYVLQTSQEAERTVKFAQTSAPWSFSKPVAGTLEGKSKGQGETATGNVTVKYQYVRKRGGVVMSESGIITMRPEDITDIAGTGTDTLKASIKTPENAGVEIARELPGSHVDGDTYLVKIIIEVEFQTSKGPRLASTRQKDGTYPTGPIEPDPKMPEGGGGSSTGP